MGAPPGAGGATRASGRGRQGASLLCQTKQLSGTATVRRTYFSAEKQVGQRDGRSHHSASPFLIEKQGIL